ncbi:MAG: nuclear transport factor 2 family protein [Anaerolineales bacterium]
MSDVIEAVLSANDAFYRALSLADFNAMQRVWLDSPDAVCVHPGWPTLQGWPAIRESWQSIFQNQGPLHVWASEARVRLYGQTAEVTCIENIDMSNVAGTGILHTRATNVYRRAGDEWKMLEHHAIPIPGGNVERPERFSPN